MLWGPPCRLPSAWRTSPLRWWSVTTSQRWRSGMFNGMCYGLVVHVPPTLLPPVSCAFKLFADHLLLSHKQRHVQTCIRKSRREKNDTSTGEAGGLLQPVCRCFPIQWEDLAFLKKNMYISSWSHTESQTQWQFSVFRKKSSLKLSRLFLLM